jgi:hypothetical protein
MTLSLPLVRVGMPWRPTPDRIPAFEKTKHWYESHGLEVIPSDERRPQLHFNIAAARNHLVKTVMPRSDVYILSDADTIPEWTALKEAVLAVAHGSPFVHLPYNLYRHEGGDGYIEGACSGILVFSYATWATLAGQDEQFRGWGFEDTAFALAHETLLGPMQRHKGTAVAAGHIPARRDRTSVNRRRWTYYRAAYGNVEQMRALIGAPWPERPPLVPELSFPTSPQQLEDEIIASFAKPVDTGVLTAPTGWRTPTDRAYGLDMEAEVGEAVRKVIVENPPSAARGGIQFSASGGLVPANIETQLATEYGEQVRGSQPDTGLIIPGI